MTVVLKVRTTFGRFCVVVRASRRDAAARVTSAGAADAAELRRAEEDAIEGLESETQDEGGELGVPEATVMRHPLRLEEAGVDALAEGPEVGEVDVAAPDVLGGGPRNRLSRSRAPW